MSISFLSVHTFHGTWPHAHHSHCLGRVPGLPPEFFLCRQIADLPFQAVGRESAESPQNDALESPRSNQASAWSGPPTLAHRPKPCPNPRDLAGTAAPEATPPTDGTVQRETAAVDQRSTARLYLRKQRQPAPQGRPRIARNPSSPPDPHLPPPRRPYPRLRLARRRSCLPRLPRSRPVVAPRGPRALHLRRVRGAARAPGVPRRPAASTRQLWRHRRMRE